MRRRGSLNLAARPFVNERPFKRLLVLTWLAAVALTVVNATLYAKHLSGSHLSREQQEEIRRRSAEEFERLAELDRELAGLDIAFTNEQARYVNQRISERTFSWSSLFDHLAETMPGTVRLNTLAPQFARGRRAAGRDQGEVLLVIRGSAKSDQALLEFLDRLFAHERFDRPDLAYETKLDSGEYDVSLSVVYSPGRPPGEAPAAGSEPPAAAAPPADAGAANEEDAGEPASEEAP